MNSEWAHITCHLLEDNLRTINHGALNPQDNEQTASGNILPFAFDKWAADGPFYASKVHHVVVIDRTNQGSWDVNVCYLHDKKLLDSHVSEFTRLPIII